MNLTLLKRIIEALIFASEGPISVKQLCEILTEFSPSEIEGTLDELVKAYNEGAFFIKKVGGGYQFTTCPELSPYLDRMYEHKVKTRLSRAALETLAIIAFRQPISKVEISAIRGVNSDGVIKNLLERQLIKLSGRDSGPGRSLLFSTAPKFLQYFALNDISDLPRPREIEELLADGEGGKLLKELSDQEIVPAAGADLDSGSNGKENKTDTHEPDSTQ